MTSAVAAQSFPHDAVARAQTAARRGPLIVAGFFLVACVLLSQLVTIADDEGRLSYMSARMMLTAPVATFYFQKLRPFMTAVYAPFVAGGESVYVAVHVAVAAVGVWLAGRLAQRVGGIGWVASAALAANPVYVLAAVAGQSNTDGITALLGGTWLLTQQRVSRRVLGGALLGATPWIRYELAPVIAVIGLYVLIRRDWRVVAGFAVWPLLYLGTGAIYHREALWFLHFLPTLSEPPAEFMTDFPWPGGEYGPIAGVSDALVTAGAACAAWPLAMAVRLRDVSGAGRALVSSLLLLVPLMFGLPFTGLLTFEFEARYQMVVLPAMAVAASVALVQPTRGTRARVVVIGALVLAVVVAGAFMWDWRMMLAPMLVGLAIFLPDQRSRSVAVGVGLAVYACVFAVTGRFFNPMLSHESRPFLAWLAEHRTEMQHRVVYTTHPQIGMLAERLGQPVRFIVPRDMLWELGLMTNRENGQFEQVIGAITPELYGGALWPCQLPDLTFRPGDVIFFRHESRSNVVVPEKLQKAGTPIPSSDGRPSQAIVIGPDPVRLQESDIPMAAWGNLFHPPCAALKTFEAKP